MKFNTETFNNVDILVSEEEYLEFKVGDFYYHSGSKTGYLEIRNEEEALRSNKQLLPDKFYDFKPYGGRHLVKLVQQ